MGDDFEDNVLDVEDIEDEKVKEMVTWFLQNYEDPVEHCPHDSSEGGYQFIWGGPFYVQDELQAQFEEKYGFDKVEEAVALVDDCYPGMQWSKMPVYDDLNPVEPDPDDHDDDEVDDPDEELFV